MSRDLGVSIMIIGHSHNIPEYLPKIFKDIITRLDSFDFDNISEPKIVEKPDALFYMFVEYETSAIKETAKPEDHNDYFDIQFIYSGCEGFGYQCDRSGLSIADSYDSNRDITFYHPTTNSYDMVKFTDKMFIIVEPGEVHIPGLIYNKQPTAVKKIVAKLHKDYLQQSMA